MTAIAADFAAVTRPAVRHCSWCSDIWRQRTSSPNNICSRIDRRRHSPPVLIMPDELGAARQIVAQGC